MNAKSNVFYNPLVLVDQEQVSLREKEVLQLISEGLTAKEIASTLYLSEHTVISHKKNLSIKLGARNTVHLIVKAIRRGYVLI